MHSTFRMYFFLKNFIENEFSIINELQIIKQKYIKKAFNSLMDLFISLHFLIKNCFYKYRR